MAARSWRPVTWRTRYGSDTAPHGTTFVALTIAAVLLTPGPTNTLLFLAGSRDGIRRSLPLSKGIGPRDLFTVTLLNPKAFFFATVVFPPLAAGPAALLEAYLIFSALLLPIAALWISMGAAVLAYPGATPRQPLVHRIASVVLMGFSGSICYTLLLK